LVKWNGPIAKYICVLESKKTQN